MVNIIQAELGAAQAQASNTAAPPLPSISWHEHTDVHCCAFVDRESQQPKASVSFKRSSEPNNTAAQMLRQLAVRHPERFAKHRIMQSCLLKNSVAEPQSPASTCKS